MPVRKGHLRKTKTGARKYVKATVVKKPKKRK